MSISMCHSDAACEVLEATGLLIAYAGGWLGGWLLWGTAASSFLTEDGEEEGVEDMFMNMGSKVSRFLVPSSSCLVTCTDGKGFLSNPLRCGVLHSQFGGQREFFTLDDASPIHAGVYICACVYVCISVNKCIWMYACTYVCVYECGRYVDVGICVCACMYACMQWLACAVPVCLPVWPLFHVLPARAVCVLASTVVLFSVTLFFSGDGLSLFSFSPHSICADQKGNGASRDRGVFRERPQKETGKQESVMRGVSASRGSRSSSVQRDGKRSSSMSSGSENVTPSRERRVCCVCFSISFPPFGPCV